MPLPKRPAFMILDVTPNWWKGRETSFADGADVLAVFAQDAKPPCPVGLVVEIVDVTIGMHGVHLKIGLGMESTMETIEDQRLALAARLDALAEGNPDRQATVRQKQEAADEHPHYQRGGFRPLDPKSGIMVHPGGFAALAPGIPITHDFIDMRECGLVALS